MVCPKLRHPAPRKALAASLLTCRRGQVHRRHYAWPGVAAPKVADESTKRGMLPSTQKAGKSAATAVNFHFGRCRQGDCSAPSEQSDCGLAHFIAKSQRPQVANTATAWLLRLSTHARLDGVRLRGASRAVAQAMLPTNFASVRPCLSNPRFA
jgi:hypothetical protein